jgi:MFS family permease
MRGKASDVSELSATPAGGRAGWYGWWVLAAATALITLQSGVFVFGFGVFFVPLVAEFGWGRAVASGAVSLARLESGLLGPLQGWLIDRFGSRRVMLAGIPLFGLGFLLLSRVGSLSEYYLVYVLALSVGGSLGFFDPASAAVANWFVRRRGSALGFMSCGIGFGTVFVPLVAWVVSQLGWRQAAVVVALTVWTVGIPLALLIRHRPEPYGYLPDGAPRLAGGDGDEPEERAISGRQALRMPAFWILALSFTVRVTTTTATSLHLIPLMTDLGLAAELAGVMTTALGGLSIVGRLGFGWLGDRLGQKGVYAGGLVALMVGFLVLASARGLLEIAIFLLLYGPAYGGLAAQMLALRGQYFGRRSFATIGGLMAPVMTLGTITGPVYAGWIFDTTGSYRLALVSFAAMQLVALALLWKLPRPRPS